jgi:golgi-specific brefeldin A-resistance guanine nucleotide exchange factor 1
MRVMALRIIDVAFEVAGTSIGQNYSLRRLATDELCRYLFQLVRSEHPLILSNSLRVTSTLLHTMRPYLKLQQELFLSYVVACLEIPKAAEQITGSAIDSPILADIPTAPRLSISPSGRSTPIPIKERRQLGLEGSSRGPDAKEVMVECIAGLTARIPTFMIDLFINYDCEVDLSDLCEDVIGFFSRNAFPDAAAWSTSNVPPLCLNALLAYIGYIADRLDAPPVSSLLSLCLHQGDLNFSDHMKPEKLLARRTRKQIIVQGASKFNSSAKEGLQYLAERDVLPKDLNPEAVAKFFKMSSRVSKRIVGEYLAKPANAETLDAFIKLFNFRGKRLDEALREMLTTFRLPGEAQQIDRIMENFARRFYESGPDEIHSADAAYVLAFSVVMLNTDQHNPQVKVVSVLYVTYYRNVCHLLILSKT